AVFGVYGNCGAPGSSFGRRSDIVRAAGKSLANVRSIVIDVCANVDGEFTTLSGPQPCPPYSYCLFQADDGKQNRVALKIMEGTTPRDPFGLYGGCGLFTAGFRSKSQHVNEVGAI